MEWLGELVFVSTALSACSILCVIKRAAQPALPQDPPQLPAPAHGMVLTTTTTTTTTRTDYMSIADWEMHIRNRKMAAHKPPEVAEPTTKMTSTEKSEKAPPGQHTPNWWPPEGDCFTYHGTPEEIREIAKKHRADRTAEEREKNEYELKMREREEQRKKEKEKEEETQRSERKKREQVEKEGAEKTEKSSKDSVKES